MGRIKNDIPTTVEQNNISICGIFMHANKYIIEVICNIELESMRIN